MNIQSLFMAIEVFVFSIYSSYLLKASLIFLKFIYYQFPFVIEKIEHVGLQYDNTRQYDLPVFFLHV